MHGTVDTIVCTSEPQSLVGHISVSLGFPCSLDVLKWKSSWRVDKESATKQRAAAVCQRRQSLLNGLLCTVVLYHSAALCTVQFLKHAGSDARVIISVPGGLQKSFRELPSLQWKSQPRHGSWERPYTAGEGCMTNAKPMGAIFERVSVRWNIYCWIKWMAIKALARWGRSRGQMIEPYRAVLHVLHPLWEQGFVSLAQTHDSHPIACQG